MRSLTRFTAMDNPNAEETVNAYTILKFLHVLSVVFWIGGAAALGFTGWRAANERDRVVLAALLRHGLAYGQRIIGPAAGVVVITGLIMVGIGHIGFGTLWVLFGYAAILVQAIVGGFMMQKRAAEVRQLASTPGDDAALFAAARRLWNTQIVYLVLFAIIIAAMVIKPTL
jgi:uncharacterized membrane protein